MSNENRLDLEVNSPERVISEESRNEERESYYRDPG